PFLKISVQDFGPGMPFQQLENLFISIFTEKEKDLTEHYTKPSVQLSQAKLRIEASGGTLNVVSDEQKGTTVSIEVPYYENKKKLKEADNIKYKKIISPQDYRILFVEDDLQVQKTVSVILREAGYQVDIASTSTECLKMIKNTRYDLIIMDLTLPDENGLVTSRMIKKKNPNQPIIALTSHATEEDIDNCYEAGIAMMLTKPAKKVELLRAIQDVLDVAANPEDE
ncbi:MAG TPA: response regulator, partial [Gammaproteobacteria bacterium]|nr:response regulator [Gammaproteobacteria bacterium]